jgi:predicted transposase YbfD/YdcC
MNPDTNLPFLTHFGQLTDPRMERRKRHKLFDILFLSVAAVLCGANDCVAIADFGKAQIAWLRKYVPLKGGPPSHDTISRVLGLLDSKEFERCFVEWTTAIQGKSSGEIVAIDGKTARRSFDRLKGLSAIHMVSAWGSANGLSLGHVKTGDKSNEITAIPKLLAMLDIAGKIVTMDAMGTQKSIAEQIIKQKADYILSVKGNHPDLLADIQAFFERNMANRFVEANDETIPHTYCQTVDADHGRLETRRCWATNVLTDIANTSAWKGIQSVVRIDSERKTKDKTTVETRYYITSLPPDAKKINKAVRTHWGIENKIHWVLDVTFREDDSRVRKDNGPQIKSALNRIAINICNNERTKSIAISRKRHIAAWNEEYRDTLINSYS